jgi:hypothetical protein
MGSLPNERRVDKTLEKMRRGGLPATTEHTWLVGIGDGRPCDSCGETIHKTEVLCTVSVLHALDWRFHEVCYDAWVKFKQP